jgi:glyoxylase-like metal-dependent hydrolase (beta-lactamase superfamily II)
MSGGAQRLKVEVFPDPMFQENGLLVWIEGRPECWIVDPGFDPQPSQLCDAMESHELEPQQILLTHCHVDHIAGVGAIRARFPKLPITAPRDESHLLADPEENLSAPLGIPVTAPPADRLVAEGEFVELGDSRWRVLDVSGHSPGGLAYYCAEQRTAIVGDAVFAEGIGRTDFPHSNHARLIENIRRNILTLPPETTLYPGHGPSASVQRVLAYNRTLQMELRSR